jgi:SAM-dependent methyltransferase
MRQDVKRLAETYSRALFAHGATAQGVLWPNASDLAIRFEALLGPIDFSRFDDNNRVRLLDLGCGPGLLLDYLAENHLLQRVDYVGVDVFEATVEAARARWPGWRFELRDVRDTPFEPEAFDHCVVCGVFTGRFGVSYRDMETMARETLTAIWPSVVGGVTFNVMSKHVDWEREDLFHWPLDDLMAFCKERLSRHVAIHLDYGLWEASVYVRKHPALRRSRIPTQWLEERQSPSDAKPLT